MLRFLIFILILLCVRSLLRAQETASSDSLVELKGKSFPVKMTAKIAISSSMLTYGLMSLENKYLKDLDTSTQSELDKRGYPFQHKLDDYFQFSPAVAAFTLNLAGVKSTHKLKDMVILYGLSNLVETGAVYTIKHTTSRTRPDGSAKNSFPSGHTATAFVAAEFLYQEYNDQSPWISVGGYTMASLIGASRIFNNRHWLSDIVAGAGVGILSTKIVYWTYPYLQKLWNKDSKKPLRTFLYPSYNQGNIGFVFAYSF
ncbi:MAG: phosphatase PAP2 family protein [Dysgonamonadaceae bacterium]|jgi:hypothetical protein|nr:phosphatase PAP2 family protein [Dysgonamonadaceae bacterium]